MSKSQATASWPGRKLLSRFRPIRPQPIIAKRGRVSCLSIKRGYLLLPAVERQAIFPKVTRAGVAGATVAALNFVSLWILVHFFGPRVSFSLAFLIALAAHFALSKFWTFRDRSAAWGRQISQYLIVAMISYLIQLAVFQSALSFLGLPVLGANAVAILVGAVVGFLLMHSWVFPGNRMPHSPKFPPTERPNATTPRHDPPA
jgi:putative flippase GtrA